MLTILILMLFIMSLGFILPIYFVRIKRKERKYKFDIRKNKERILDKAIIMLRSDKVLMSFDDDDSTYAMMSRFKSILLKRTNNYSYINFPRAWLMIGLLDYYEANRDENILNEVVLSIDKLIDSRGRLKFEFKNIDQCLFGMVFLRLYLILKEDRYANASHQVYKEVQNFLDVNGMYFYRKNVNIYFVDTIGMVCPFLYLYGAVFDIREATDSASFQLVHWINILMGTSHTLPYHAYDVEKETPLGSCNWSRGIAWFIIGLSYGVKYEDKSVRAAFESKNGELLKKLTLLQKSCGGWGQFLGHDNSNKIDASSTVMLLYAQKVAGTQILESAKYSLESSISSDGYVMNNSGDTIYINKYSREMGNPKYHRG